MLGCYRKGEANDPKIYAATVAAILARYSKEVVDAVTDPVTGLPTQTDFMPTPKEVREACEREASRRDTIKRYAALPKPMPRLEDGNRGKERANLFVPDTSVKFPSLLERHEGMGAESPCWIENERVCVDGVKKRGLMVPMGWYEAPIKPVVVQRGTVDIDMVPELEPTPFDDPPIAHPEEAAA